MRRERAGQQGRVCLAWARAADAHLPACPPACPQDNLILAAVVAACTLFILVYW